MDNETRIKKMAKAGATLSKHFSRPFSKDWYTSTIRLEEYTGVVADLVTLWRVMRMKESPFFEICGNADLDGVIYPNAIRFPDMHQWKETRWEYEIRRRMSN